MIGQNMWHVYYVYNVLLYTYVHLLVLLPYLIAQCTVTDHLKFLFPYYHSQCFCIFRFKQLYLGNHSEIDMCSYELLFSHND
jgi:hypothetical protein